MHVQTRPNVKENGSPTCLDWRLDDPISFLFLCILQPRHSLFLPCTAAPQWSVRCGGKLFSWWQTVALVRIRNHAEQLFENAWPPAPQQHKNITDNSAVLFFFLLKKELNMTGDRWFQPLRFMCKFVKIKSSWSRPLFPWWSHRCCYDPLHLLRLYDSPKCFCWFS